LSILEDIHSRGYLEVVIRPQSYRDDRVPFGELEGIVRRTSLRWRGWDFPHVDPHEPLQRDVDWVGQESAWNHHLEVWRIWMSGQFTSISGFASEWRDRSDFWPADGSWEQGATVGIMESLLRYVEAFTFASRLSVTRAGDEEMQISLTTANLAGRTLIMDDPSRFLGARKYQASIESFPYRVAVQRQALLADPRSFAFAAAQELYARFGLELSTDALRTALESFDKQVGG
jgi:hypothetical protein